jgi:hypothetical protein
MGARAEAGAALFSAVSPAACVGACGGGGAAACPRASVLSAALSLPPCGRACCGGLGGAGIFFKGLLELGNGGGEVSRGLKEQRVVEAGVG